MTAKPNDRGELVKELENLDKETGFWRGGTNYDVLVDFIISDRNKVLNSLKGICISVDIKIDETLKNAGIE